MNAVMGQDNGQQNEEDGRFLDVIKDLIKIKAWQERTEASIGDSLPILGREFPNLWSALDYSIRQEEEAKSGKISALQKKIRESQEREESLNNQLKVLLVDVTQSFENVKSHFGEMSAELGALKLVQARQSSAGTASEGSSGGARIQNGVLFPPHSNPGSPESFKKQEPGNETEYNDTLKIVVELKRQITKLEVARAPGNGGGGDVPPHFEGLGLTCIEDLASWNMEWGLGHYFGLFQDANLLLTFKRSEYVDAHDHVATLKRACDVSLNLIQAKLLVSFQNQVPLFFGKGSPNKTLLLNALPMARDWEEDDGTSRAKHDLDQALPVVNKQLQSYIDVYLGDNQHEA